MFCFNEGDVEKIKIIFNKSKICSFLILNGHKEQTSLSKNLEQMFPDFEEAGLIIHGARWWRGAEVKNILV